MNNTSNANCDPNAVCLICNGDHVYPICLAGLPKNEQEEIYAAYQFHIKNRERPADAPDALEYGDEDEDE